MLSLYDHQLETLDKLHTGSILCGGVGSGKSLTAIAYYYTRLCGGTIPVDGQGEFKPMTKPKDLYIITTARKRDTLEWEKEAVQFAISSTRDASVNGVQLTVDSWNNIGKYIDVKDAFFIFDEQRLVGAGAWVKSFLKITKVNDWILLSATPGDVWMDYVPVFIANGFYRNRTEFTRTHVVYSRFTTYPSIDRYVETKVLEKHRQAIIVNMRYERHTTQHNKTIFVKHDEGASHIIQKERWNIFESKPIQSASELCYLLRKVNNSDITRVNAVRDLILANPKTIIFYNFNYELDILRELTSSLGITTTEWNGQKHELIPKTDTWVYLVQYTAGAEGWNCIDTNVIIFYSQNYSYKVMIQSAGRIDRLNTPYDDLYYYHIRSTSSIDTAIAKSLKSKRSFNEAIFAKQ